MLPVAKAAFHGSHKDCFSGSPELSNVIAAFRCFAGCGEGHKWIKVKSKKISSG